MTNLNKTTSTNYQLGIPLLPTERTLDATKELVLNIFGTIIPSVSLDQSESKWQGNKMLYHVGGMTFDVWNIQFIVDSEYNNWSTLFKWLTSISNNYNIASSIPSEYMVDCSLKITDNFQNTVLKILFKNVWILSLGEVMLSQREGESQVECSATLVFDRYEIVKI